MTATELQEIADDNLTVTARMHAPALGITMEQFKMDWHAVSYGEHRIHSEKECTKEVRGSL